MKEKLVSVVKSPAVRKSACALLLAILSAFGYSQFGCTSSGQLTPKVAAALEVFECQLNGVKGFLPQAALAEEVVNAVRSKNYEYAVKTMTAIGMDMEAIKALAESFDACSAESPASEPEPPAPAGVIQASL